MHTRIFNFLTILLIAATQYGHAQTTEDSAVDNTYGKGGQKRITTVKSENPSSRRVELIFERIYDAQFYLKESTDRFKNRDGSTEITHTYYDYPNNIVKYQKLDVLGSVLEESNYVQKGVQGPIVSGSKWKIDSLGEKQEYVWHKSDTNWVNAKDTTVYTRDSVKDTRYGTYGYKITVTGKNVRQYPETVKEKYYNSNGKLMYQKEILKSKDGAQLTTEVFYNDTAISKVTSTKKDALGNAMNETVFMSGNKQVPASGKKWVIDSTGNKIYFKWDPAKYMWVKTEPNDSHSSNTHSSNNNFVAIGPSWMHFGDKDFHFSGFGLTGSFTHMISNQLGVQGELGTIWHKKTEESGGYKTTNNFSLYTLMAGVDWFPGIHVDAPLSFSAHALAGIMSSKSKNSASGYSSSASDQSFAANIGATGAYQLNTKLDLALQANYVPTFFASATQSNVRVDLLLQIHL